MRNQLLLLVTVGLAACNHPLGPAPGKSMGKPMGSEMGPSMGWHAPPCTFKGFAPAVAYATAEEGLSITVIDRTRNGHADLIVGDRGNKAPRSELFANRGDGTFTASASYGAADNNGINMVSADFDGDGKLDLASESGGLDDHQLTTGPGNLGIDLGTADGRFATQLETYTAPSSEGWLAAGDLDGDGHPDVAYAGNDTVVMAGHGLPAPVPTNFALHVFLNHGDGTFAAPKTYPSTALFDNVATGDFNGDGLLDVAGTTATDPGGFGVFYNAGDGTFGALSQFVATDGWSTYGLGVADFDGDGRDDVATTTFLRPNAPDEAIVLEIFAGTREGGFAKPASYPIGNIPSVYQVVTGDFDGDGKPDVAAVFGKDSRGALVNPIPVQVFTTAGDGSLRAPVTYHVGDADMAYAIAIAAGDFNGDGVSDLAVTRTSEIAPYPTTLNVLLSRCE